MEFLNLVLGFIISLLFAVLLYTFSGKIAPKFKNNREKELPYTCGEDLPPQTVQIYIPQFYYLVFFTIMEVALALLTIAFYSSIFWVPFIYVILVSLTLLALPRGEKS